MISRRQLPELRHYAVVEAALPIVEKPELASLVVPNGNSERPGHRWFKYKEAFSADLLIALLEQLSIPSNRDLTLVDPFCGVGTSLLSAQLASSRGYRFRPFGIECNPLAELISRTKLQWHRIDARRLRQLAANILKTSHQVDVDLPQLSSISTGRCISPTFARHIVRTQKAIHAIPASPERDALTVALASTIEPVSKVRRDGRALRLVEKNHPQFKSAFAARLESIAIDVEILRRSYPRPVDAAIHLGDGRSPQGSGFKGDSIDLIVTSPPYPNNIDYNEIYKLELWLLGLTTNASDFLDLRRKTFRSHPTCSPPDQDVSFATHFEEIRTGSKISPLLQMITSRVENLELEHRRGRSKVLLGYAFDTWCTLVAHYRILRSRGTAVYVVGNSLHGGQERPYLIATDLLLARLAQEVGFTVESIMIARPLSRRVAGNHFLRDSVVILKKP